MIPSAISDPPRKALPAKKLCRGDIRVLVVEDDEEMRSALREILIMCGFLVNTAADGVTAAQLARLENYDLILSDIRLPGMDGFSVARSARSRVPFPKAIFITAFPDWKVYEEAYEVGAWDVLLKPVSLKLLARRILDCVPGKPTPR